MALLTDDTCLSARILKSLCFASLLLAAFDAGRYVATRIVHRDIVLRTQVDSLLIDLYLGFLVAFGVMHLPGPMRKLGMWASLALAFLMGVRTMIQMLYDKFGPL